jgi:hypothetical protein
MLWLKIEEVTFSMILKLPINFKTLALLELDLFETIRVCNRWEGS